MRNKTAYKATAIGLLIVLIAAFVVPAFAQDSILGWKWDSTFNGYVLEGVQDGTADIQVNETNPTLGPILSGIRGGAPAKFVTSVSGQVIYCVGDLYAQGSLVKSKNNCDGVSVDVPAGEIIIKNSTGPTGGFRWVPKGSGWQIGASQNCPPQDGTCWEKQPDGSWKWTGAVDGSADIHQAAMSEVLAWVRSGGVVTLNTNVSGQIIGTCHAKVTVNDTLVEERHDCGKINTPILVSAGKIVISNSTTEQGGWRWSPRDGIGWRAPITATPRSVVTNTPTPTATNPPSVLNTATPTVAGPNLAATQQAIGATQTQMAAPPVITDSDRDGVPDAQDVCANTPVGTRVDATGCPIPSNPPPEIPWWLWLIIGLIVLLLIVAAVYYFWRRSHPTMPTPITPTPPTPAAALQITTVSPLPTAAIAGPWIMNLSASGGTGSYRNWRLGAGRPAWMGIDPNSGQLFGTAVDGDFNFEVSADDSATPSQSVTKMFHLHVGP